MNLDLLIKNEKKESGPVQGKYLYNAVLAREVGL